MDALTVACIVLVATNISFAVLAERSRRATKRLQAQLDSVMVRGAAIRKQAYTEGVAEGIKSGIGQMYKAALQADRRGLDIIDALRTTGYGLEAELKSDREAIEI